MCIRDRIETDLTDLHVWVDGDRKVRDVREFECHLPGETWVDEASGRMNQETETTEARLALEPCHDVVSETDHFQRRSQDELSWVKNERFVIGDDHLCGQVPLGYLGIDAVSYTHLTLPT